MEQDIKKLMNKTEYAVETSVKEAREQRAGLGMRCASGAIWANDIRFARASLRFIARIHVMLHLEKMQ